MTNPTSTKFNITVTLPYYLCRVKQLQDEELFQLVQQDDGNAFAVFMERYSRQLYKLIMNQIRNAPETKDIMQDIFISCWKNRHKIVITGSAYPYLYRAAKNAVVDYVLDAKRQTDISDVYWDLLPGNIHSIEEEIAVKEMEQAFQQTVNAMPETMKKVIRMSREDHLNSREIATLLNISEQTVRNNISMALHKLREQLGLPVLLLLLPSSIFFDFLVTLS